MLWQGHAPASNGDVGSAAHDAAAGASREQEAGGLGGEHQQQQRLEEGSGHGGAEHHAHLTGRASRAGSIQDTETGRADADLEASVLDTLTDSVLTGAPGAKLSSSGVLLDQGFNGVESHQNCSH